MNREGIIPLCWCSRRPLGWRSSTGSRAGRALGDDPNLRCPRNGKRMKVPHGAFRA